MGLSWWSEQARMVDTSRVEMARNTAGGMGEVVGARGSSIADIAASSTTSCTSFTSYTRSKVLPCLRPARRSCGAMFGGAAAAAAASRLWSPVWWRGGCRFHWRRRWREEGVSSMGERSLNLCGSASV